MKADAIAIQAERRILLLRSHRVMLDSDLAELYGVETKALNRAVKRNLDRFPEDFAFQLTSEEFDVLRRQIGTSKRSARWVPNLRKQFSAKSSPADYR